MGEDWIAGVDAGGTGCRARVFDASGALRGAGEGGPANLLLGDGAAPFAAILGAVARAATAAGVAVGGLRVGVGAAGATEQARARFFARRPPFAETRLITDTHAAALGAHGGADGGVAILGTGAAACVIVGGAVREIGGWGLAADDLGSGADIGRRAVRAVLRALDGDAPLTALSAPALASHGGDPWRLAAWSLTAQPADWAALAPLAFEAAASGDAVAEGILAEAAVELARLVALTRLFGAARTAVLGSVALRLRARLALAEGLVAGQGDAVDGAALAVRRGLGWTA